MQTKQPPGNGRLSVLSGAIQNRMPKLPYKRRERELL